MSKEKLSAKRITIWICVNYVIFVLGFLFWAVWEQISSLCGVFHLRCFPCSGFAGFKYSAI